MSQPKAKRRIQPTFMGVAEPEPEMGLDERPSILFQTFMQAAEAPDAEEYFNRRAAELGYGELKIKKKAKKSDEKDGKDGKDITVAEVAPPGRITQATDADFQQKLDKFILKYAELKKHDKKHCTPTWSTSSRTTSASTR